MKKLILWNKDIPISILFEKNNINFDNIESAIIIITGNIGCGKTKISKEIIEFNNKAIIINDDAITEMLEGNYLNYDYEKKHLYHAIEEFCVEYSIKNGYIPIIDMPNMSKKQRKRFIDIAKKWNAIVMLFDFGSGTAEDLIRRIKDPRGYHDWSEVFKRKKLQYEEPTFDEGFNIIIRLN